VQRILLEEQLVEFIQLLAMRQADHPPAGPDIGLSDALVLLELSQVSSMTQRALTDRLTGDKSTVSRSVTRLADRGWVNRTPQAEDKRVRLLQLTAAGRDAAAQMQAQYRARHRHLVDGLTVDERRALSFGLGALIRQMKTPQPTGTASPPAGVVSTRSP
jgi:DNA-binding MarR family transcriptional regulator